jgi:oligopeptidase B
MVTDTKTIVKRTPVLGFDGSQYAAARLEITARDGARVPVSVAWKKQKHEEDKSSFPLDAPCLLTGYGSYGVSNDPSFSREDVPLLNRGVVVCVAHVRGGGEMGREWYEKQGKYLTKKNTFFDFVDVANGLIKKGMTSPTKLAIAGRSAGGLLVGASINLEPRLFKCAVAAVPFVDVMVSMCDASIPLTTGEWEEWGNPNEMKYFPYMLSYSPMENIAKRARRRRDLRRENEHASRAFSHRRSARPARGVLGRRQVRGAHARSDDERRARVAQDGPRRGALLGV